jgi:hypothetical protein
MAVEPSPKSQAHIVGFPDDRSVNCTVSGTEPEGGLKLKSETISQDGSTVMYRSLIFVLDPPRSLLATSLTVYVPGF